MAHGDYDCCAICDVKMDYAPYTATTKESICEECLINLKEMGFEIKTVEEFRELIFDKLKYIESKELLMKLNYNFCCYDNELDRDIFYRYFCENKTFNYINKKLKEEIC